MVGSPRSTFQRVVEDDFPFAIIEVDDLLIVIQLNLLVGQEYVFRVLLETH